MTLGEIAALNALIGPFLPPLIAVVNQPKWPTWGKSLAMLTVCAITGTMTTALNGDLLGLDLPAAVLACAAGAVSSYHVWWKPKSGITDAVEHATSPTPKHATHLSRTEETMGDG